VIYITDYCIVLREQECPFIMDCGKQMCKMYNKCPDDIEFEIIEEEK